VDGAGSWAVLGLNHGVLHCSQESFVIMQVASFLVIACVVESVCLRITRIILSYPSVRSFGCLETYFRCSGFLVTLIHPILDPSRKSWPITTTQHLVPPDNSPTLVCGVSFSFWHYHRLVVAVIIMIYAGCVYWSLQSME